jgi:hypothetical protein
MVLFSLTDGRYGRYAEDSWTALLIQPAGIVANGAAPTKV